MEKREIMGKDYKNISLAELNNDINGLEDSSLGNYFDNELSMTSYRDENGYLTIIEFFNHLRDTYNECINKDINQAKVYHGTLLKTFSWFLPFLKPYHKIIVQSNICILADDEQDSEFHKIYFSASLEKANKLIKLISNKAFSSKDKYETEALCRALDSLGYLNIREHNYEYAILCIRMCVDLLVDLEADNPANTELFDLYIGNIVRLANCYEYTDDPWSAIKCILKLDNSNDIEIIWQKNIISNADIIRTKIIHYYNLPDNKFYIINTTIDLLKEICGLFYLNISENRHFSSLSLITSEKTLSETWKTYIHVLAHCISEYAAKIRVTSYSHPLCSTLQMFSRFLIDWLVESCQEDSLVTCQATIRAENDACPEALKLLLKRHALLEDKLGNCTGEELSELQEIEFFLFYFSEQELRYNYTDKNLENIFKQYGDKFFSSASQKAKNKDFDPLFHYYVIKFKYLFKHKIDEFINTSEKAKLDTKEVDNVFLEMCRCKERCSDHIFKGLLDECERLEDLFALFQQLRWLFTVLVSETRLNWFKQLWSFYDKNDKQFNIKDAVTIIYNEIIRRNKILILAPVKNAPSCSSEYDNIQNLLELPTYSNDARCKDGEGFLTAFRKIKRNRQQTNQYSVNLNDKYSALKWAIYYPNEGSFIYFYMKNETDISYSEVIPLYLDTEHKAVSGILQNIEDGIIDEFVFLVSNNSLCSAKEYRDECDNCNTFLLRPNDEGKLRKLINELLAFLEFDFSVAHQDKYLGKEHILINYPNTNGNSSHDFWVLAFYEQLPDKDVGTGLCDICRECFVKLTSERWDNVDSKKCKIYSFNKLKSLRDAIYNSVESLDRVNSEQKELIKLGKPISDVTSNIRDLTELCNLINMCIQGKCSKSGEKDCDTCRLLKENNYI